MIEAGLLPYLFLIPLLALGLLSRLRALPLHGYVISLVVGLSVLCGLFYETHHLLSLQNQVNIIAIKWVWMTLTPNLSFIFAIEPFGMIIGILCCVFWLCIHLYSNYYWQRYPHISPSIMHIFMMLILLIILGMAFAANMVTLFCAYQLLIIVVCSLFIYVSPPLQRQVIARISIGLLLGTSTVLCLPALFWVFSLTGTTDFILGGVLQGKIKGALLFVLLVMLVAGMGQSIIWPLNKWLLKPVSDLPIPIVLLAILLGLLSVISIIKMIIYIFSYDFLLSQGILMRFLAYFSGITALSSMLISVAQVTLRQRLLYLTLAQFSLITLSASLLTSFAVMGAILHTVSAGLALLSLWMVIGNIEYQTEKTVVNDLKGLAKNMPLTFTLFGLSSLALIGYAPTIGWVSYWYIIKGIWSAESSFAMIILFVITILNVLVLAPLLYGAMFQNAPSDQAKYQDVPMIMLTAPMISTALGVVLFFNTETLMQMVRLAIGIIA